MLEAGTKAPEFTLPDSEGSERSLSEFRGSYVILYFYPKDNTPGCTTEACAFRDSYERLADQKSVVIGVSGDSVESHRRFKEKHHLPFILLSDPERKVIDMYGALKEKKMFGKTALGIVRSTYIIDREGTIIQTYPKVTPKDHAEQITRYLENLT